MARRERGLFRIILRDFLNSLKIKIPKHTCVGEDYLGTKYYQIENVKSIHKKSNRYFVPKDKNNFEQEIPAEWEAWLRHRRKIVPTTSEVIQNYEMILTKRKNAAEIEATYAKQIKVQVINPDSKPLNQHASLNFPVYEEYKEFGRNYKPKPKDED